MSASRPSSARAAAGIASAPEMEKRASPSAPSKPEPSTGLPGWAAKTLASYSVGAPPMDSSPRTSASARARPHEACITKSPSSR
ncbi:MAG TPA: hypothetical protein DEF51_27735 [Myxococcales bacterium]|nr:hypothetical protein [Myxococcales bacterium]